MKFALAKIPVASIIKDHDPENPVCIKMEAETAEEKLLLLSLYKAADYPEILNPLLNMLHAAMLNEFKRDMGEMLKSVKPHGKGH